MKSLFTELKDPHWELDKLWGMEEIFVLLVLMVVTV